MNDEIITLQEMVAHQSEDISKISHELYLQQREIGDLKERIKKLEQRLKEQGTDSGIRRLEDETPPPHY